MRRLRLTVLAVLLGLFVFSPSACVKFPESGPFGCDRNSDCSAGQMCNDSGRCVPSCAPKSCADFADQCGAISDGCGGAVECTCTAPRTCGGNGRAGYCGCLPRTCRDLLGACGDLDDGCGGTVGCGCSPPDTCGGGLVANQCGCTPTSCAMANADCGVINDGCGGSLACGNCSGTNFCGGGGPNRCGVPALCSARNATCGFIDDGGSPVFCGRCSRGACGAVTANTCDRPHACVDAGAQCGLLTGGARIPAPWCGRCAEDEACNASTNRCETAARPFCWGPAIRLDDVNRPGFRGIRLAADGRGLSAWSDSEADAAPGCSRHVRLRLATATTAANGPVERLASSDFDHLDEAGCGMRPPGGCSGWVGPSQVAPDGLETFTESSYVCADWFDRELYVSVRASVGEAFQRPALLSGITLYRPATGDSARRPVLLADGRTMIYMRNDNNADFSPGVLHLARRGSDRPGDAEFVDLGPVVPLHDPPADGAKYRGYLTSLLSCDGRYLIYERIIGTSDNFHEARMVEILSTDPLRFGTPSPYDLVENQRDVNTEPEGESPDCSFAYYRQGGSLYGRVRQPCN